MAKLSVEVMILLFGTLTLWLGFLKIAEHAGLVEKIAGWLSPLFRRLMPQVPKNHPAVGLITMNFIANALGFDTKIIDIGGGFMAHTEDGYATFEEIAEKIKENDNVAPFEPAYIVYDDSDFIKFKSYEHAKNIIMMRMLFK